MEHATVGGRTVAAVGTGFGMALARRGRQMSRPCPCPCRPCQRPNAGDRESGRVTGRKGG